MKRYIYIAGLLLTFVVSGCSNEDSSVNKEQILPIAGIPLSMEGVEITTNNAITRGSVTFSVNTAKDPTKADLNKRTGWLLDFALYNGNTKYDNGSFEGGTYNATTSKQYWAGPTERTYYFPNYFSPGVELLLYSSTKKNGKDAITTDQSSSSILSEDVLMQKNKGNNRPTITPAHIIIHDQTNNNTESIHLTHKHAMLDFAITDINTNDIDKVTVEIAKRSGSTTTYTPHEISSLTDYKEYMLILPEGVDVNPVIKVTTKTSSETDAIKYKQEVKIISGSIKSLGTNNCYCFTLKGKALELSPITIVDWARGKAIQGEYIAVTAYPTFKATGHANETFYFYYDNKLLDGSKAKLQEIKFNENAECTIKPDGRILTHIFKAENTNKEPTEENKLGTPIILGQMIVDVTASIKSLNSKP